MATEYEKRPDESEIEFYVRIIKLLYEHPISFNESSQIWINHAKKTAEKNQNK
jgi:hypothetical protein